MTLIPTLSPAMQSIIDRTEAVIRANNEMLAIGTKEAAEGVVAICDNTIKIIRDESDCNK